MTGRQTPFDQTVAVDANGCWIWQLAKTGEGYGHVARDGYAGSAHRWMWMKVRGPIPSGLQIDHLCRVRACVNPDHLELVSGRTNRLRGTGVIAENSRKSHCFRGHAFDESNTRWRKPQTADGRWTRHCRACEAARMRRRYWATKDAKPIGESVPRPEPVEKVA